MTREEYLSFMYDESNAYRCSVCPENTDAEDSACNRCFPCGQQNCWVVCHCERGE